MNETNLFFGILFLTFMINTLLVLIQSVVLYNFFSTLGIFFFLYGIWLKRITIKQW